MSLTPVSARRAFWLPAAAFAALWLPLLLCWSAAWSAAPEQAYGWAVPALALYLLWERWRTRPALRPLSSSGRRLAWLALIGGMLAWAAALVILEANALWPAAQWAAAAAAVAVTLAGIALGGGGARARHLAFPLCFVFTALAWPGPVNRWIVANLVRFDARAAAEIVSACGYPAVVAGNAIEVARGWVDISDACSGLRSLQAVGMVALFFGELFLLSRPRRAALIAVALLVAMAGNLGRASFLAWQVAAHGPAAGDRWHDPAGSYELAVTLAAVIALAWIGGGRRAAADGARPASAPTSAAGLRPLAPFWVVLGGAAVSFAGAQGWYLAHEWGAPVRLSWRLVAPDSSWRSSPVPATARAVLRSTEATGLAWQDAATGTRAWAFAVSWRGQAAQSGDADWHDPTVCLPAAGGKLERDLGPIQLRLDGVPVTFWGYRFGLGGIPLEAFFCFWDAEIGRSRTEDSLGADIRQRRLERVREGRRGGDVSTLTLEIESADDAASVAWLKTWAPRLLHASPLPPR